MEMDKSENNKIIEEYNDGFTETCKEKRYYVNCGVWKKNEKGCAECPLYLPIK